MYDRIRIQNFRGIRDLTVENLGRVNLLVGGNDVGKTSVLEALALLHMSQTGYELEQILENRGYTVAESRLGERVSVQGALDGLFRHGARSFSVVGVRAAPDLESGAMEFREFGLTGTVDLSDAPPPKFFAHLLAQLSPQQHTQLYYTDLGPELSSLPAYQATPAQVKVTLHPGIPRDLPAPFAANWNGDAAFFPGNVRVGMPALAKWLSTIEGTPAKREIDKVLQNLDGRFERLAVAYDGEVAGPALNVTIADGQGTLPAALLGDGVRRIVEIVALLPRKGVTLGLIDEVDIGIYAKRLPHVWRLFADISGATNVQLFATTHSWECVEAAITVARESPIDVRLHRIDRIGDDLRVTTFDHETAEAALELNVEVR